MLKKSIVFLVVLTTTVSSGMYYAFAAASVRQLGTPSVISTGATKSGVSVQKQQVKQQYADSLYTKAATIATSKDGAGDSGARISGAHMIKAINTGQVKPTSTNVNPSFPSGETGGGSGSGSSGSSISGVSMEAFKNAVNRIQALEDQNTLTEVVETGVGNYVSSVSVDDNHKLNVTKTRLLYVPVRQGSSENVTGDAEIWLVR